MKGYRCDDIASERWIYRSRAYLSDRVADDIHIELD
jgi:hypothetical protein